MGGAWPRVSPSTEFRLNTRQPECSRFETPIQQFGAVRQGRSPEAATRNEWTTDHDTDHEPMTACTNTLPDRPRDNRSRAKRMAGSAAVLQDNPNRWYDSSIGRWLNEDPLGLDAGDFNLRRYVGNNGLVETDPSGLARYQRGRGPRLARESVDPSIRGNAADSFHRFFWTGMNDAPLMVQQVVTQAIFEVSLVKGAHFVLLASESYLESWMFPAARQANLNRFTDEHRSSTTGLGPARQLSTELVGVAG